MGARPGLHPPDIRARPATPGLDPFIRELISLSMDYFPRPNQFRYWVTSFLSKAGAACCLGEAIYPLCNCARLVSGYAFVGAFILGPNLGYRGLSSKGPFAAKLVYSGMMLGATTSVLGTVVLLYAAWLYL